MKTKITVILSILIIASGLLILTNNAKKNNSEIATLDEEVSEEVRRLSNSSITEKISFDASYCELHPNQNYLCTKEALGNFGLITVKDTPTGKTCSVSYDGEKFYFSGQTKQAEISAGELAASINESTKEPKAIIRHEWTAGKTLSIYIAENGKINSIGFMDADYSNDQCLEF